jgi:4-amino-4-deoxy-L-arabinose transferase-like glycosyltransferase
MTLTADRDLELGGSEYGDPRGTVDPRWVRPSLIALLVATAALYLWDLGASGWANAYYSAAVQAGSHSWKAFLFGSFDAANAITVDKPPASLWAMDISARLFGVNAWSILVPQALMGVGAVWLLYAAVRRTFSPAAGLVAGATLALTPVAALMFRFNNPDALLVLLLVAAGYAMVRALEAAGTRWVVMAGALIGFAFLAKMLQAFLVLPGFAAVYLAFAPTALRTRIVQLLKGGAAMVAAAGWWVLIVTLWPASSRPYIGGSQHNSVLELVLGYNGLGRLTGNETGSVGGGGAGPGGQSRWGATGWLRMFDPSNGGQISWLMPAALVLLAGLLWLGRRQPRTDARRAQLCLWGSWLLVTAVVFSQMQGIFHEYYTVALAPAVAAIVGIGAAALWRARSHWEARAVLAVALVVTVAWSHVLLARSPQFHPSLRTWIVYGGVMAAAALIGQAWLPRQAHPAVAGVALVAALAGPASYTLETVGTGHEGSIVTAGPAVTGARMGPGGGPGGGLMGGGPLGGQAGGPPGLATGQAPGFAGGAGPGAVGGMGGPGGGGLGGLLNASAPNAALVSALKADASSYTWAAAAVGANSAAGVQLATGLPVLAIGGFNGSDPAPTLAEFQALVAQGKIHYFLGGGGFAGQNGGSQSSSEISAWVQSTYTAQTLGGVTVYDLSSR